MWLLGLHALDVGCLTGQSMKCLDGFCKLVRSSVGSRRLTHSTRSSPANFPLNVWARLADQQRHNPAACKVPGGVLCQERVAAACLRGLCIMTDGSLLGLRLSFASTSHSPTSHSDLGLQVPLHLVSSHDSFTVSVWLSKRVSTLCPTLHPSSTRWAWLRFSCKFSTSHDFVTPGHLSAEPGREIIESCPW